MPTIEMMFRLFCAAVMIFGWIWNQRRWGFRGPKKLIDGDSLIIAGFIGLIIAYPSRLICLALVICIVLAQEFRESKQRDDFFLGIYTIIFGITALVIPNIPYLSPYLCWWTFIPSFFILIQWYIVPRVIDWQTEVIIQNCWKDSGM